MPPLFEANPVGLKDFVRVKNTEPFISIFNHLASVQVEVLYNHSRIFPFAYLNTGRMELYLNKDFSSDKIIPVVKKFTEKPQYSLYTPHAPYTDIIKVVEQLTPFSSEPVDIIDVTESYAAKFLEECKWWEKTKTSDDVVQCADKLAELAGRNFSSLRNTLRHVRNDIKPEVRPLSSTTATDAVCVFERWKDNEGVHYFRRTVGRDVRLVEEYADKMDFENIFGYVYYVNKLPAAVSFGCRSAKDREWGVDVTQKGLYNTYKGISDFAFIHLMQQMYLHGIKYVNDSGGAGPVRKNKLKFAPLKDITMYDLRRK